jgi:hypothetical protein
MAAAAQLKKNLESRDRRRQADRAARVLETELEEGVYAGRSQPSGRAQGAQAVAALSSIVASADVESTPVIRCDLCNVSACAAGRRLCMQSYRHTVIQPAQGECLAAQCLRHHHLCVVLCRHHS